VIQVRRAGRQRFSLTGHAYDISAGGVRFELDRPLPFGEHVEVRINLPGADQQQIAAQGVVVRYHDDQENRGPVRMALSFTDWVDPTDKQTLDHFVDNQAA
jgi:c-di-GMP-binding flagellar brake protein YcgR